LYSVISVGGDINPMTRFDKTEMRKKYSDGIATHFEYSYPGMDVPLIVENTEVYRDKTEEDMEKDRDSLVIHEEQHIINNFFTDTLFFDKTYENESLAEAVVKILRKNQLNDSKGAEGVREDIVAYAEGLKKQFLRNAQNEFTAYLRQGYPPEMIADVLLRRNFLYDFFWQNKKKLLKLFNGLFKQDAGELFLFLEEAFYESYDKDIKTAATLCKTLLTKYSTKEISTYLNVIPIWKWQEITDKLMSAKN